MGKKTKYIALNGWQSFGLLMGFFLAGMLAGVFLCGTS